MIRFRTLRSGSSGNLLLIEVNERRRFLVDCGLSSQRALRESLETEVGLSCPPEGVLLTHAHSDHVNYGALRVLSDLRIPVYLHERTLGEVRHRHLNPFRVPARADLSGLELRAFGDGPFRLDGLEVTPIAVPHAPQVTTHAFVLYEGGRRLLVASDLSDPEPIARHAVDCDLIYLESNHDRELLRTHFNPSSLFHLPNPTAALFLRFLIDQSRRPPQTILLGHLSEERNTPELALEAARRALAESESAAGIRLEAAPRHAPGPIFEV